MFKLIDNGPSHRGIPRVTQFKPGDLIDLSKDRAGRFTLKVVRDANTETTRYLFLGEDHSARLATLISAPIEDAWKIVKLFLDASWILTEISTATEDCILARVIRIATCHEEMDPRLPCCDAGGDGFGRE